MWTCKSYTKYVRDNAHQGVHDQNRRLEGHYPAYILVTYKIINLKWNIRTLIFLFLMFKSYFIRSGCEVIQSIFQRQSLVNPRFWLALWCPLKSDNGEVPVTHIAELKTTIKRIEGNFTSFNIKACMYTTYTVKCKLSPNLSNATNQSQVHPDNSIKYLSSKKFSLELKLSITVEEKQIYI